MRNSAKIYMKRAHFPWLPLAPSLFAGEGRELGVRSYPWVEAGRSPSVNEMVSVEAPRTTVSETLEPGA